MPVSRRTFALGLAATGLARAAGQHAKTRAAGIVERRNASGAGIVEQRVYAPHSALPPLVLLHRHGIHPQSVRHTTLGTEYRIPFASPESRCAAWDRFNSDPAWCALRGQGNVQLREIAVTV
jgi:hypothetical protein